MAILIVVSSFVMAILARLFADDIKAWLPVLSRWLKARAVRRLPEESRARYEEEWESHLLEVPGDLSKIIYSLGLQLAAWRIRGFSLPSPGSIVEAFTKLVKEITASKFGLLPEPERRSRSFLLSMAINMTVLSTVLLARMITKIVINQHVVMTQRGVPATLAK
jgi:hypothetical protein